MSVLFCILIYYVIAAVLCIVFFNIELHKPGMIDYYDNEELWQDFKSDMKTWFREGCDNLIKQFEEWPREEDFEFKTESAEEVTLINMFGHRVMDITEEGGTVKDEDTVDILNECYGFVIECVENDHYINVFANVERKKTILTALIPFYRFYQLVQMCLVNGAYEDYMTE